MANLEAKLTISAEDKTAAAFDAIHARVERMHRDVSRVAAQASIVDRMSSYITRGGAGAVGRVPSAPYAPSVPRVPHAPMVPSIIPGGGMGLPTIIGGAAIAAGVKSAVTNFADLEDKVTSLGITAEASNEKIKNVMHEFMREGPKVAATAGDMGRATEKYVAASVSFDDAVVATLPSIKAAKASGSELNDIVDAGTAAMNNLGVAAKDLPAAFDIMAKGGKLGQFELKDMARELPAIAAKASSLQLKGREGLTEIVAQLEIVRKVTGSGAEAANRLENFYGKILSADTMKHFRDSGVDLEKELKAGAKRGIDYVTTALNVVQRETGGDPFKIAKLYPDAQAQQAVVALLKFKSEHHQMVAEINSSAIGTNLVDFDRRMNTTKANIDKLSSSWNALSTTFGETIAPPATAVIDGLTKSLQAMQHPVETATESFRFLRDKADAGAAPYDPSVRPSQRKANRLFNALIGRDGDAAFGEAPLPATDNWAGLTPGKWLAPDIPYDPSVRPGQRKANRLFNSLFGREGGTSLGEAPPRFAIPSFGFGPAGSSGNERVGAAVAPGLLAFAGKGVLPPVKLEGSADISVKVEVSTEPGLIAREVSRQLAATGALSPATGTSMPEASPTGRSGGF